MEGCLRDRLRRLLVVAALVAGLGACEGITPLTADATQPPSIHGQSPIRIPEWAGKRPSPYDGTYEGYLINESVYFFCPTGTIYFPLSFEIANGLVRRTDNRAQAAPVDGYINDHGVFVANTSLKAVFGQLFIGSISDDRMRGEWRSSRRLCYGRIELVRVVDDQRYCEDRLSGKPYATRTECRGIDRFLTKREFEAMPKTTEKS